MLKMRDCVVNGLYVKVRYCGEEVKHWNVQQNRLLSNYVTACNTIVLYIPNTHVASSDRGLLPGFSFGLRWVYLWFTLGPTSKSRVNTE